MKPQGDPLMAVGGSCRMDLAARLAQHEGAEVTSAGRSQEQLRQAELELGQVPTIVMEMTDAGTIKKGFAGTRRVDHGRLSAGTIRPAGWAR